MDVVKFFNRHYERTEHDDFVLNVAPYLTDYEEAVAISAVGVTVGWLVQAKFA